MRRLIFRILPFFFLVSLAAVPVAAQRTIEFTTTEVTEADVTVSPDGQWLIFTMLGHLFRLPVTGGTAEQLTFGPYYDTDPIFSPDGKRAAFVSDRDGSEGNIFVLELATATGQITQVTHEPWAGRPTWSPDGQAIVYLRFVREAAYRQPYRFLILRTIVPALVRRVALSGEEPETLAAPARELSSIFYLPDGRLAWTVIEQETRSPRATTRIEVMSPQGTVSTLRTLQGVVDRVVASPTGDGLYCRRYLMGFGGGFLEPEDLLFLPLPEGAERQIIPLSGWALKPTPRFAVGADNKSLYLGAAGRPWKVTLPDGLREPIPFSARVKLEVQDPVPPARWVPAPVGGSAPPRSILDPRLSPDGRTVVFGAAGYLWQQPVDGAPAKRLFEGSAFEREPAFSPDGHQLAFVHTEYGQDEVRVFNFETRQTRTLASGIKYAGLSWSPDRQRLVLVEAEVFPAFHASVVAVNVGDGKQEKLTESAWLMWVRPHFSSDGQSLYFSGPPGAGTLYRLRLADKTKPEPVTRLARPLVRALVSPNGKWLAFPRNTEIWVAPLGKEPVEEEDVRQLSPEGGDTFAFTPDSSAVIYSAGNRVWRHPLGGGEREEIPIRLELKHPVPPPLLLRRVRVLDFEAGGFGRETSVFIEQGRIRWMGSERGRKLPQETIIVDAGGRFAIPGLFDMHVHGGGRTLREQVAAFLAYGVTSVRDVGGSLGWLNSLADRGQATGHPVPRYFVSGEMFEGAEPPRASDDLLLHNQDDARSYVRRFKEGGARFIKVHPPILSWPLQRAIADEARRLGLPVVGHGITLEEITRSVTLGYFSLEHMLDWGLYDDVIQMLALAGTRLDPTLTVPTGYELLFRDEPERLGDVRLRAFIPAWRIHLAQADDPLRQVGDAPLRGLRVKMLAGIRAAHQRGVKLHVGTDAGFTPLFYGASLHWELENFVQAGIPRLEVLRIATLDAAEAVGAQDDLGTLEPGKLADIVLLDKNPLEDIRNTQTIWRVIKGGWLFDPDELRPPQPAGPEK